MDSFAVWGIEIVLAALIVLLVYHGKKYADEDNGPALWACNSAAVLLIAFMVAVLVSS